MATVSLTSSHLRRQREQQEARKLSWGFHDGVFYNMILAADYIAVQGEVAVQESSSEGLPYVAYLDAGDVLSYRATLESAGTYRMEIRIASPMGEGNLLLRNSQNLTQIYATIETFPASGDWNSWETIETTLDFLETDINLDLVVDEGGWNLLWLSLEMVESTNSPTTKPLQEASPAAAPDSPPVSAPDLSDTCIVSLRASAYTGADEAARVSSQDNSLELNANSWATYSVQVPADGTYLWRMKLTMSSATGALDLTNAETEELYASIKESTIDSWRNANIVLVLEAGTHIVKISTVEGSWRFSSMCLDPISFFNVDYIESSNNTSTMAPTTSVTRIPTMAPVVPLTPKTNAPTVLLANMSALEPSVPVSPTPATSTSPSAAPAASSTSMTGPETSELISPTQATNSSPTPAPTASPTQATNSSQTAAPSASPLNMPVSETSEVASPTQATNSSQTAAPTASPGNTTLSETSEIASPTQATSTTAPTASPVNMTVSETSEVVSPTQATNSSQTAAPSMSPADMTEDSEYAVLLTADKMSAYGVSMETSNEDVPSVTQLDAYDWVRYPMSTVVAGNYTMEIRVSSESGEGAFDLVDYSTGSNYSSIDSIPATGVDVWETINSTVTLPEGDVYFMIRVREGGWKYSWIRFSEVSR